MRLRKFAAPLFRLALLGGIGYAAYATRDQWTPHVFPEKPEEAKPAADDHGGSAENIKLSAQAQKNLGLHLPGVVRTVAPRTYWRKVFIPGEVVDRPGESDRAVTSRVAGTVTEIKARPGDTVKGGDPLFVVQLASEFVQTAQADIARVARERAFAATKRDQIANFVKLGTRPGADLIEEDNQVKRLTAQAGALRRQLKVFGLADADIDRAEAGDAVTEITVAAPPADKAAFEIQSLKVKLGQQVTAGQTLCELASHQRLFVEGHAFKSEAKALTKAAELKVEVEAEFADEAAGDWPSLPPLTIHHLANEVDPETRTFSFFLSLDNQPDSFVRDGKTHLVWRFRPGQRVRLKLPVEKLGDDVFVLPAAAVVREGPDAFVFSQAGDIFERNAVRVLHEDRTEAVVANDGSITARQLLVLDHAVALNRAIKAAAAGGEAGHSHDH